MLFPVLPDNAFILINDYANIKEGESPIGIGVVENGITSFYSYNFISDSFNLITSIPVEIRPIKSFLSKTEMVSLFLVNDGADRFVFLAPQVLSFIEFLLSSNSPYKYSPITSNEVDQLLTLPNNNSFLKKLVSLNPDKYSPHILRLLLYSEFFLVAARNVARLKNRDFVIFASDKSLTWQRFFVEVPSKLPAISITLASFGMSIVYMEHDLQLFKLENVVNFLTEFAYGGWKKLPIFKTHLSMPDLCTLYLPFLFTDYLKNAHTPCIFINWKYFYTRESLFSLPNNPLLFTKLPVYLHVIQIAENLGIEKDKKIYFPCFPKLPNDIVSRFLYKPNSEICKLLNTTVTVNELQEEINRLARNIESILIRDIAAYITNSFGYPLEDVESWLRDILYDESMVFPVMFPQLTTSTVAVSYYNG